MRDQVIEASTRGTGCALSSASSAALTDGCSAGVSRPYQAQPQMSSSAGRELHSSACCQPNAYMSEEMSGGITAAPSCRPMLCSPCTSGQRSGANHDWNTPAETG